MINFKRLLSAGLACAISVPISVYAQTTEIDTIISNTNQDIEVTADVSSSWVVTLPKAINLLQEDDKQGSGNYKGYIHVTVQGDIGVKEVITVDTNTSLDMIDSTGANTEPLTAIVTKDKIEFNFNDLTGGVKAETEYTVTADLVPGNWHGTSDFRINIENRVITVIAKDENGNDLNASATEIQGNTKETLLTTLEETGMISNKSQIDAIVEVNSDEFDGIAETTFEVSNIAKPGDMIAIFHFDEVKQEWEFISTEVVSNNNEITADFSSYSPVAFMKIDPNQANNLIAINQEAGLYDANNNLIVAWNASGINNNCSNAKDIIRDKYPNTVKVIVGDSATQIYGYSFNGCSNIKSIILPKTITKIGAYAFSYCTGLRELVIREGITQLSSCTFVNNSNLTVKLPDSLKTILGAAFDSCNNMTIITGRGNLEIYAKAFTNTSGEVILNSNIPGTFDGVFTDSKITKVTVGEGVTSLGARMFIYGGAVKEIKLPTTLTSIGNEAFKQCTSLQSVNLENTKITSIGDYTFESCDSLTEIVIPDSVTIIGTRAFNHCDKLNSVKLPSMLTSIKANAFYYCPSLTTLTIPAKVNRIESYGLNTSALTTLIFENPNGWKRNGTAMSSTDMSNPSTAARYLDYNYYTSSWIRS